MDRASIARTVEGILPLRARWVVRGTTIDWDFSRSKSGPREPRATDFNFAPVPTEWLALLLIGQQDVAEGGGASSLIGVHPSDERVLGLDPEREARPLFFLNSSLDRFIDTFLLFDSVLGSRKESPGVLAERALAIDPEGFHRSDWKLLAEFALDA